MYIFWFFTKKTNPFNKRVRNHQIFFLLWNLIDLYTARAMIMNSKIPIHSSGIEKNILQIITQVVIPSCHVIAGSRNTQPLNHFWFDKKTMKLRVIHMPIPEPIIINNKFLLILNAEIIWSLDIAVSRKTRYIKIDTGCV